MPLVFICQTKHDIVTCVLRFGLLLPNKRPIQTLRSHA